LRDSRDPVQEISARFSGFEQQAEQDARMRRDVEQAHFEEVCSRRSRLEHLVTEAATRGQEREAALRATFEARLSETQGRLEALFLGKFDQAHLMVDTLNDRMQAIDGSFPHASEVFIRDMAEESSVIHAEYWEFRHAFEDEMTRHQDYASTVAARLAELEKHTSTRLMQKQQHCEQKWSQLEREAWEARRASEETREHHESRLLHKLQGVRDKLQAATKEREQADDDIVAALNHYTQTLQGTLSSVSRSALLSAGL